MLTEFFSFLEPYLYIEYAFAILIVTDLVRFLIPGIDKKIKARWLTFLVAVALSVPGYILHVGDFSIYKALTSFGFAIMAYNYIWKPLKLRLFPGIDERQKE